MFLFLLYFRLNKIMIRLYVCLTHTLRYYKKYSFFNTQVEIKFVVNSKTFFLFGLLSAKIVKLPQHTHKRYVYLKQTLKSKMMRKICVLCNTIRFKPSHITYILFLIAIHTFFLAPTTKTKEINMHFFSLSLYFLKSIKFAVCVT